MSLYIIAGDEFDIDVDVEPDGALILHINDEERAQFDDGVIAAEVCGEMMVIVETLRSELAPLNNLRPIGEYHEDYGPVLWWKPPIDEAPYCGEPGDSDWPGYHTHWSELPIMKPLEMDLDEG